MQRGIGATTMTNEQIEQILDGDEIPAIKEDGIIGVTVSDLRNIGAHMTEMVAHLCHDGYAGEGGSHRCKYQDEILTLRQRIEELEQRNDELSVTVERLRFISETECADEDERIADIQGVLEQTPQQSLAERNAEESKRHFMYGYHFCRANGFLFDEQLQEAANEYAQRIKDGE